MRCVTITLSPEVSFIAFAVYPPPTATNDFFDSLSGILKKHDGKEILNWLDKAQRKKRKDTFQMTQMINEPTRITKSSQILLDLIFTNKAERITKTYLT